MSSRPTGVGWLRTDMHYSKHPLRDPATEQGRAWRDRERASRPAYQWAQEYEIDFEASTPGRIFADAFEDRHVYTEDEWISQVHPYLGRDRVRIVEGWDYGGGTALTAVVWVALVGSRAFVLDYRQWAQADVQEVAEDVRDAWASIAPVGLEAPHTRIGDIYDGKSKARHTGGRSLDPIAGWISNLRDFGIYVSGQHLRVESSIAFAHRLMRSEQVWWAPECMGRRDDGLPSLVECVTNYRRQMQPGRDDVATYIAKQAGAGVPPPLKDIHSHAIDALMHALWAAKKHGLAPARRSK